jgi:hypothetical protein
MQARDKKIERKDTVQGTNKEINIEWNEFLHKNINKK